MSLQSTLNLALEQAVRQQNAAVRTTLRTVLGEAETKAIRIGKPVTDGLLNTIMKDFIANNTQIIALRERPDLVAENALLKGFLLPDLTESELQSAIQSSACTNLGAVMNYLKEHFSGRYDGAQAKTLAAEWLKA